jgi:ergothioneine biosynthesis protein EgtB
MLQPFALANRPVNCGEFLAFIADGGYGRPEFWLSDGWAWRRDHRIEAPLYWWQDDGQWLHYTAAGAAPVDPARAVCHVSFYEAWAYASWSGARLPLEGEWERAACGAKPAGHFSDSGHYQPDGAGRDPGLKQLFGDVWEWTGSSYAPYPGFRPAGGAVGEYNGKFMANQMVLRGGSCATPPGHVRATYRNFFYPGDRWQYSGFRLARDLP